MRMRKRRCTSSVSQRNLVPKQQTSSPMAALRSEHVRGSPSVQVTVEVLWPVQSGVGI